MAIIKTKRCDLKMMKESDEQGCENSMKNVKLSTKVINCI